MVSSTLRAKGDIGTFPGDNYFYPRGETTTDYVNGVRPSRSQKSGELACVKKLKGRHFRLALKTSTNQLSSAFASGALHFCRARSNDDALNAFKGL